MMLSLSVQNSQSLKGTVVVTCTGTPRPTQVTFYLNDVAKFTDMTDPFQWSFNTTEVPDGTYTIKAIGKKGNNTFSATLQVKVMNASPPPVGNVSVITTAPTISGQAVQGQTLTVSDGTWSNSPTSFARQWLRCDAAGANAAAIAGATGQTYVLVAEDVGKTIRCRVTAYNAYGASAAATSAQTAVITAPPAPPPPVFTTNIVNNQVLTMPYEWTASIDPMPDKVEFWYSSVAGAVKTEDLTEPWGITLDLPPGSYAMGLCAWYGATRYCHTPIAGGRFANVTVPTVPIQTVPEIVEPPQISGTPVVGKTLVSSTGLWTQEPDSYTYQWFRYDAANATNPYTALVGQTASSYVVVTADLGKQLVCSVTPTNEVGDGIPEGSAPTAIVTAPPTPPVNTTLPAITGTMKEGATLTVSNGAWTNTPTSYQRQWIRCDAAGANGVDIAGATAQTYVLAPTDVGKTIRCRVTAFNSSGSAAATSAQTAVIGTALAPPAFVSSSITVGQTVTGTVLWSVATAGDVASVEFWVDNVKLGTDSTPPTPFTFSLNTTLLTNGDHHFGLAIVGVNGTRLKPQVGIVTVNNAAAPPPAPSGIIVWNADLSTNDYSQYGQWEYGGTFDGTPPLNQRVIVGATVDGVPPPYSGGHVMKIIASPGDDYGSSTGWRCSTRLPPEYTNGGEIVKRPHGYEDSWTWFVRIAAGYPFGASIWHAGPEFHSTQYVPVAPYHFIIYADYMKIDVAGNKGAGNANRVVYVNQAILNGYLKDRWYVFTERYKHGVYPNGHYELWYGLVGTSTQMQRLIYAPGIGSTYKNFETGELLQNYMLFGLYRNKTGTNPCYFYNGGIRFYKTLADALAWANSKL